MINAIAQTKIETAYNTSRQNHIQSFKGIKAETRAIVKELPDIVTTIGVAGAGVTGGAAFFYKMLGAAWTFMDKGNGTAQFVDGLKIYAALAVYTGLVCLIMPKKGSHN